MATVGFIGLGNMGLPMAENLVKAGHVVKGFDISATNLEAAQQAGLKTVTAANDAADDVAFVLTMLPSGKETLEVYRNSGVMDRAKAGTIFVDCSTIDVASSREAHELADAAGMRSLDCPVSGGVTGAVAGTLTMMAGGADDTFAASAELLACMSQKAVHCGGAGAGQSAKICNNMLLGISMIGVSEAFVLAEKLGLSKEALFDVASTSSGQCWSLTTYCPVPDLVATSPANNDYKPGFAVGLMLKDLKLAQEAAASGGAATPLGAHATEIYDAFADDGHSGDDFSAVVNFIRSRKRD